MSFLGGKELEAQLRLSLGEKFKVERIAQVAYELSLGNEIYRTDSKEGVKEILEDNCQIIIEPGQFALLLTDETIEIPPDILAFISIKFKLKKKGLVNISGFHVDPGFVGKIKFSVYNAGPSAITLDKGKPYFLIWLSQLTSVATKPYSGNQKDQEHIDDNDVNDLKGEIASPNELLKLVNENKEHLTKVYWALGILITLTIGIIVNLCSKNASYEDGYKFRIKEESLVKKIDSLSNIKVDSIFKLKNHSKDSLKRQPVSPSKLFP